MAEIKILIEGYAKKTETGWIASSTVCLVTSKNNKIITDPGCNRKKLLEALYDADLKTDDIDYVFLSHCHPDHILLAGIFEKAKFITYDSGLVYDNDKLKKIDRHMLGKDIEVINTPGHVPEHLSLIVKTPDGKVAIAGDAIWWTSGKKQVFRLRQKDESQSERMNMEALVESRKKLLKIADHIIPGH